MSFEKEVLNILDTKTHAPSEEENVPVIKYWLGWEDLQLIQILTQEEKQNSKTAKGLFTVLCSKFKLKHNRIIISLQYHKLQSIHTRVDG